MLEPVMQLELIRFVASIKPLVAASKVSERIITIIKSILLAAVPAQVWLHFYCILWLQLLDFYSLELVKNFHFVACFGKLTFFSK